MGASFSGAFFAFIRKIPHVGWQHTGNLEGTQWPQKEMQFWSLPWLPLKPGSDLTLNCKGVVSILGWCRSANKHIPVRGREGKSVLTLQDLCLLNQIKTKYQLLRIHPIISVLQRTVELRCSSQDRLYLWARKQWRSHAWFPPTRRPWKKLFEEKLM